MNTERVQGEVAVIGAGYWGKNLVRNFHALEALRAICDPSAEVLAQFASGYEGLKRLQCVDAVLADPQIARVAIAAPATQHFPLARAALLAGKDVFVEKPLCLEIAEAEELTHLAEQHGRILMVGHLLQYHPCVTELQRMVGQGELGKLQYITSNRLNLGKIRQEENSLWSFAPHDISVILSLVGGQVPQRVRCTGESYLTPRVADTTLTTFQFVDGIRGHVFVSWLNPFKEQKLTVVGSKGMAVFDDTRPWGEKLIVHRDYLTWSNGRTPTPSKSSGVPVVVAEAEPLRQECLHFLQCCRDRVTPRTDGAEAIRVLQVLKAAQWSLDRDGDAADPKRQVAPSYFSHPSAVVDPAATVGAGTKIWHFSHVMAGAQVGECCNLGQNVVISPGVVLGRNVKVQNNVSVYTGTTVEDDVFLGPSCVLTNISNPRSEINRQKLYEKTVILRGATVGANATVVCGTTLGRFCFVAAGSVVTRDVPDYAFMVGSPARQRGWMSRHGHVLSNPDSQGIMTCPESGLRYRLVAPGSVRCWGAQESVPCQILQCIDLPEEERLPREHVVGLRSYREFKQPLT